LRLKPGEIELLLLLEDAIRLGLEPSDFFCEPGRLVGLSLLALTCRLAQLRLLVLLGGTSIELSENRGISAREWLMAFESLLPGRAHG
jgi:hypothetical protein